LHFVVLSLVEVIVESRVAIEDVFEGDFKLFADGLNHGDDIFLRNLVIELLELVRIFSK
jgi:hypothetical protein